MSDHPIPRLFVLQRDRDVTGVSGPGPVADGVQFQDGTVVLRWRARPSVAVWNDLELMLSVHGHDGATRVIWNDQAAQARAEFAADIVEAFDVPGWVGGQETERETVRRQLAKAIESVQYGHAAPVEVGDERIVAAAMSVVDEVLAGATRARRTAGRAYQLADRWEAAHGAARFLVRAAGAELREALDDETGGIRGLLEHVGIDTRGRDITVAGRIVDAAAAECSAEYHGHDTGPRLCIRAAQHRGDHIDDHGFHWSDTVAVYPVVTGEPAEEPCTKHRGAQRQLLGCNGPDPDDQDPPNQGPLTGIEMREPCPYCSGAPLFPRSELPAHLDSQHARVVAVLACGGDLDEQLAPCDLPHEMEA